MTDLIIPPARKCTTCGEEKPLISEHWYKCTRDKQGYQTRCRVCQTAYFKKRYESNPNHVAAINERWRKANPDKVNAAERKRYYVDVEKARAEARRYYANNREKCIERSRTYRLKYPEKAKATTRRYKLANPERSRQWLRDWHARNPGKSSEYYHKHKHRFLQQKALHRRLYRVRLYAAEGSHTVAEVNALYEKQEGKCAYCGIELNGKYHADHIMPLVRGGSDYIENIACACADCNRSKNAKTPEEWAMVRGW